MSKIYVTINNNITLSKKSNLKQDSLQTSIEAESLFLKRVNNLPILLKHIDKILVTPEYYFILLEETFISVAYIGSKRNHLYLGELLSLYSTNKWIATCPKCSNGTVYIRSIGGSPLSGAGSGTGVCINCKDDIRIKTFSTFFGQFMKLDKRVNPEGVIPSSIDSLLKELTQGKL